MGFSAHAGMGLWGLSIKGPIHRMPVLLVVSGPKFLNCFLLLESSPCCRWQSGAFTHMFSLV